MASPKAAARRIAALSEQLGATGTEVHQSTPTWGRTAWVEYLVEVRQGARRGTVRCANFAIEDRAAHGFVTAIEETVQNSAFVINIDRGAAPADIIDLLVEGCGFDRDRGDALVAKREGRSVIARKAAETRARRDRHGRLLLVPQMAEAILDNFSSSVEVMGRLLREHKLSGLDEDLMALVYRHAAEILDGPRAMRLPTLFRVDRTSPVGTLAVVHLDVLTERLVDEVPDTADVPDLDNIDVESLRARVWDSLADFPIEWRVQGFRYVEKMIARLRREQRTALGIPGFGFQSRMLHSVELGSRAEFAAFSTLVLLSHTPEREEWLHVSQLQAGWTQIRITKELMEPYRTAADLAADVREQVANGFRVQPEW